MSNPLTPVEPEGGDSLEQSAAIGATDDPLGGSIQPDGAT